MRCVDSGGRDVRESAVLVYGQTLGQQRAGRLAPGKTFVIGTPQIQVYSMRRQPSPCITSNAASLALLPWGFEGVSQVVEDAQECALKGPSHCIYIHRRLPASLLWRSIALTGGLG